MTRKNIVFILLLASSLLMSACSGEAVKQQGTEKKEVELLFNFATNSLDPHIDSSYVPLRAGITETLVRLNDETLTIEPWLAESWTSEDGQTWTIKLRDGITFQNGNALDGAAVKASLERAIAENIAVKNALRIDSIEVSGNMLTVTTEIPFPEFPSELVHPNTAIIDVTEQDLVNQPIGTGPFAVESFVPGTAVKLVRYDGYWDGAAKLEAAIFSFNEDANARSLALKAGETDIVFRPEVESLDSLKAIEGVTVESTSTFRVHQLTMNMQRPALQDINVRKAIDALIDRQAIVDLVLQGHAEAAKGPFPSAFSFAPAYSDKRQGIETAKEHLKKAGYIERNGVMQKDGKPLGLTLLTYSARADLPLIAQVFQSDAKQLGINVTIRQIEIPEEFMASNREWDLATYSNLTAPRGDAGYYLNATYHPNGALNFSKTNDAQLTAMIEQLNGTVGQQERSDLTEKIAEYVDEHVYNAFLLHPNTLVAYDKSKVKNWVTYRSEYYMLTNELDVN